MSNETVDSDSDFGRGGLTESDQEYLRKSEQERKEDYSRQARSMARSRIRKRARAGLHDMRFLADHLDASERERIFAAKDDPRGDEYPELRKDVEKAIEFIYTGMGGESAFRDPLKEGVASGEVALGNIDSILDVAPTFAVDVAHGADVRTAVELVEAEEWDRLDPPSLATFVKTAVTADAIDFDKIQTHADVREWVEKYGKYSTSRVIPGGKRTPRMERNVYESEGIGDMTGEELRELFGEGHYRSAAFYDGEAVYELPRPGSDVDPELLYYVDK